MVDHGSKSRISSSKNSTSNINICLMTGNIGRVGTGPNSITGQCNAMGSRLFSNTTGLMVEENMIMKKEEKLWQKL